MTCKDRLESCLRDADVPYAFEHHRTVFTASEVAQTEHIPGRMMAKSVIVEADGKLALLALPATEKVDLGKVEAALHAKHARLASEEEFQQAFPDCELGAMPVFGNLYGLPVVVDSELAENDNIVMQAGTHTDTVRLRYADFARLVAPLVAEIRH